MFKQQTILYILTASMRRHHPVKDLFTLDAEIGIAYDTLSSDKIWENDLWNRKGKAPSH